MRDEYVRSAVAHTAALCLGCAAVCIYAAEIFAQTTSSLIVAACGFVIAAQGVLRFDARSWTVPTGADAANLRRRRDSGIALGAGAVACAVQTASGDALHRALMVCQVLVMAVAAVNDFARFRLPLPTTISGGLLAVTAALQHALWPWNVIFALVAGGALVLAYRWLARADLGGGDELALCWVVLADPFHGPAAICAGQAVLALVIRLSDPRRAVRRVPIGGAWLMAAAWLLPLLSTWSAM
jgi:hypothetical protein